MYRGIVYFYKRKTAYDISACLVGSEMCIRVRFSLMEDFFFLQAVLEAGGGPFNLFLTHI